jgi:hypothetical protein
MPTSSDILEQIVQYGSQENLIFHSSSILAKYNLEPFILSGFFLNASIIALCSA